MMQATLREWSALILLGLFLWGANVQADFCRNNLPASNPDEAYINHGNGTVTDKRTSLMWKQCAEGLSGVNCESGDPLALEFFDALAHAEASTFAGNNDWRLPNVKELSSLVDVCTAFPSINTNHFPNTPVAGFWSGSPILSVSFADGNVRHAWTYESQRVRLVRDVP
ncbi:DUF1566 domain-containing protein [Ectothiorhodospira variabilis]|uniref:Lcl C-terminal domain-containing protein n=1 Tax=Ectothiorhodospira variabilis TaxID=505694 RepID=UPI001EFB348D|nr:DUF1566 domain-containing protein [Ectothiorhodospira variabilis]MCG5493722.1 DUF1566 domain-containing protein [Ectothiorhodospira variabilis]MCG5499042.1 DUF1566 domain-containing protein [Ectothiorhodospira variabilis]MCG5505260.1 DUF1566 domain-containing protein [Ectothiorhodospira variabilis]MCG5508379.1 DUF1566 domain-containing protein [Ectothiorhodospira variabilis]